ncbi:MAG: hypothetical protein KBA66_03910 [Leptospiraceae bacterium]|nr:hypothetical protein [Leptospiraceae bacterium]
MKEMKDKNFSVKYVIPNKKEREKIDKLLLDVKEEDKSIDIKKLKKVKNKKKVLKKAS